MDTLLWEKLTPTVKFNHCKKLFFNKFLYKATVFCPGSRLVVDVDDKAISVADKLKRRELLYGVYLRNSSITPSIKSAVIAQLDYFLNLKRSKSDIIKMRCEEPYLDLYCQNESQLFEIVDNSPMIKDRLLEVYGPKNAVEKRALLDGKIIMSKECNYKYKIILKNKCDYDTRQALYKHLLKWGDQVSIPPGVVKNLNSAYSYGEKYFYAMDKDIKMAIDIIDPNLITQIFPIHIKDQ
jgi:hypothetical protein